MVDLDARTLLMGNQIFTEFKGTLMEQYVCQQILAGLESIPYYWSAESSGGEVDFFNPGNSGFTSIRNDLYIDKSGLIGLINETIPFAGCVNYGTATTG